MLRLLIIIIAFAFSGTALAQQYDWQNYQVELKWAERLSYTVSDFADQLADRWTISQEGYLLEAGDVTEEEAVEEVARIVAQRARMYERFTGEIESLLTNKPVTSDGDLNSSLDNVAEAANAFLDDAALSFALDARLAENFQEIPHDLERDDLLAELSAERAAANVFLAERRLRLQFVDQGQFLHHVIRASIELTESQNLLKEIDAAYQRDVPAPVSEFASELRDHVQRLHRIANTNGVFASSTGARWQSELDAGVDRPDQHEASIALALAFATLFDSYERATPILMEMMADSLQAEGLEDFQNRMNEHRPELNQAYLDITANGRALDEAQARLDVLFE